MLISVIHPVEEEAGVGRRKSLRVPGRGDLDP